VPAAGGAPEVLIAVNPETEVDFHWIALAPGGRLLTSVHRRSENSGRVELIELSGGRRTVVTDDQLAWDFRYASPGVLLFRRLGPNQGLWTLPFAEEKIDMARASLVLAGATDYSVSEEGTIVARSQTPASFALEWLARDGSTTSAAGAPIAELQARIALSPRGDRVAFTAGSTEPQLFVRDLTTGADTRLTTEASGQNVSLGPAFTLVNPAWFPGGDRLLYGKGPIEGSALLAQRADGAGQPTTLAPGSFGHVSADGRWLLWLEDARGQGLLRYASFDGSKVLGEARTFPGTEKVSVRTFDLSPDGRLLVYSAQEANRQLNIHLTEFPGAGARWQVTTEGGTQPRFSRDSRELLFSTGGRSATGAPEGQFKVMSLSPGPPLKLGVARALLSGAAAPEAFDVAPNGRLLIARRVPQRPGEQSRAVLVQNWPLLTKGR
jgi:dipeptidyl aminopeptidase/acylaminoacyl peptidase